MNIFLRFTFLLCLIVCVCQVNGQGSMRTTGIELTKMKKEAEVSGKPFVIFLPKLNCVPCMNLEVQITSNQKLSKYLGDNYIIAKAAGNEEEWSDLRFILGLKDSSNSAFLVFLKNGSAAYTIKGVSSWESLLKDLQTVKGLIASGVKPDAKSFAPNVNGICPISEENAKKLAAQVYDNTQPVLVNNQKATVIMPNKLPIQPPARVLEDKDYLKEDIIEKYPTQQPIKVSGNKDYREEDFLAATNNPLPVQKTAPIIEYNRTIPAVQPAVTSEPPVVKKTPYYEKPKTGYPQAVYAIQIGSFENESGARKLASQVQEQMKIQPEIFSVIINGKVFYRVIIGSYRSMSQAELNLPNVLQLYKNAIVIKK